MVKLLKHKNMSMTTILLMSTVIIALLIILMIGNDIEDDVLFKIAIHPRANTRDTYCFTVRKGNIYEVSFGERSDDKDLSSLRYLQEVSNHYQNEITEEDLDELYMLLEDVIENIDEYDDMGISNDGWSMSIYYNNKLYEKDFELLGDGLILDKLALKLKELTLKVKEITKKVDDYIPDLLDE